MAKAQHDKRHGGPYDRGAADSWYMRHFDPHYLIHTPGQPSIRVGKDKMTRDEVRAYHAGYEQNESDGFHKVWD